MVTSNRPGNSLNGHGCADYLFSVRLPARRAETRCVFRCALQGCVRRGDRFVSKSYPFSRWESAIVRARALVRDGRRSKSRHVHSPRRRQPTSSGRSGHQFGRAMPQLYYDQEKWRLSVVPGPALSLPQMIYLDNNATTRVAPEVFDAMLPHLTTEWGNPSSAHPAGRVAPAAVVRARDQVARLQGAASPYVL